ncbi:sugar phosphate nucleotidyltransferase [Streptomyces sp. NPDC026589]|uniref:sugar phosphate nucleotidyltransferase n=1 Tax=Streptomyces sp. NPDC026589 TaxID=3155609 RepID=UPI0033E4452C
MNGGGAQHAPACGPMPVVVILCGGQGLRLRDDTDDLPKPLRPLHDGRPLLLHVLDYYRSRGCREFVLCLGYGAAAVRSTLTGAYDGSRDRPQLTYVDSGPEAEKCDRLLDARPYIAGRRFLLGYADILSDVSLDHLLTVHEAAGALVTLVGTPTRSRFGRIALGQGSRVARFEEKPPDPELASAGYFLCEPALLDRIAADHSFESEILPALAREGQLAAVVHDSFWQPLDTYKDFLELETLASTGQAVTSWTF